MLLRATPTCRALADWVKMTDPLRQALFAALGVEDLGKLRLLARLPLDDWKTITDALTIGEAALTPMQSSQLGLYWESARLVCGLVKTLEEQAAEREKDREKSDELELEKIKAASTAAAATAAASTSTALAIAVTGRKFALDSVTDQTDKTELVVMTSADIAECYRRYNDKFGAVDAEPVTPAVDEEPTSEQLTGLKHILGNGDPPYVDFALFCPHGNRARRNHAFSGLVLGPDGNLLKIEAKGPSSFEAWAASWKIFKVAAVMLNAVSVGALDLYHDHLQNFAKSFGPDLWMLLSQAERRMRGEHWERIRRRGEQEHRAAQDAGRPHGFRAAQPWDWVIRACVTDFTFWYREFESVAVLIKAKVSNLGAHLGIDSDAVAASGSRQLSLPPPPTVDRPGGRGDKRKPTAGGPHVANRKGVLLCEDFQRNQCHGVARVNGNERCSRHNDRVHQCQLCLGTHVPGSSECRGQGKQPQPDNEWKSKGNQWGNKSRNRR